MRIFLSRFFLKSKSLLNLKNDEFYSIKIGSRSIRQFNVSGRSTSALLLSPAEASKILRANEATVDLESKCPIKYYDVNFLGANNPPEDRQAQAKCLHNDVYLFGVFDGFVYYFKLFINY